MTTSSVRREAGGALAPEDVRAVLDVVTRLRTRELDPATSHPERPLPPERLEAFVQAAREVGVVPDDPSGPGLWAGDDPASMRLSIAILRALARAAAGPAFELHQRALALRLARRAGLPEGPALVPLLFGRAGLGRDAFAALFGDAQDDEARAVLLDAMPGPRHGPEHTFALQAGPRFGSVIAPILEDDARTVGWVSFDRTALELRETPRAHGLDETALHLVGLPRGLEGARRATLDAGEARMLLLEAAALSALGVLAVALGAAERALDLAREQARTRVQGGRPIGGHAAVRLLLGRASTATATVGVALGGLDLPPRTFDALMTVLRVRAAAHPLLCDGANAALQVFGGTGYMRDTGLEKIVRDENHLRLLFGTPEDLVLLAGRWEVGR